MDTIDNFGQHTQTLEVTEKAKGYLKSAASWSNFMAIINFIGIGILALTAIIMLTLGTSVKSYYPTHTPFSFLVMGIYCIGIAVLMFFPARYLLRFSRKAKIAVKTQDTPAMEVTLENLKAYWKFNGILTIIALGLCCLSFPIIIIVALMAV